MRSSTAATCVNQNAKSPCLPFMKIQLASDLHLEFLQSAFSRERLISPACDADVLELAGDIACGRHAIELFGDWPVPVLYVARNHEFYGFDFLTLRKDLLEAARGTSVRFLDDETADFGGVRFLGATLWTDYLLCHDVPQAVSMQTAERALPTILGFATGADGSHQPTR